VAVHGCAAQELIRREITLLHSISHPNIIQLGRVLETPYKLYMLLEFVPGGELFEQLQAMHSADQMYSEADAARLFKPLVEAVVSALLLLAHRAAAYTTPHNATQTLVYSVGRWMIEG
jgi:serine/threonine protein kinase